MNRAIRCLMVDDEPYARKGLQGYIEKTNFLFLAAPACENVFQLVERMKEIDVDLLYLDIEMPCMNGIDFLKSVTSLPKIIFTTAYEQYAVQGFDLDIIDYLLKPISYPRFLHSAEKAREYFTNLFAAENGSGYIFIKTNGEIKKLLFEEIIYIEAMENYLAIHTDSCRHIIHATIKGFLQKLPPGFIQTHKSYVVSIAKITGMHGNMLYLGNHEVPVSKTQKMLVKNLLLSGI
jgi:DNA-binding LytR/AlgR family response regulator